VTTRTPPKGLGASGRALWRAVLRGYELSEAEAQQLRQACATFDLIDQLEARLSAEDLMGQTSQGPRVHPIVAELRQQRITAARLLAALNVPTDDPDTGQSRGVRGVYRSR